MQHQLTGQNVPIHDLTWYLEPYLNKNNCSVFSTMRSLAICEIDLRTVPTQQDIQNACITPQEKIDD